MRQKLNENPVAQIALVGVLVVVAGYLVLTNLGGGGEPAAGAAGDGATTLTVEATLPAPEGGGAATLAAASTAVSAPSARPLPAAVERAYARGEAIVLLVYRPGGIEDRRLARSARVLRGMPGVALFSVPVAAIARYAPITGPLGVNQAPALVVVRSRRLNAGEPAPASVDYGFRSAGDVRQAVRDSAYRGPRLTYAPN